MYTNGTLFLIGLGAGICTAIVGGMVEYWISLRPGANESVRRLPSCLLFVAGGLAAAGIVAIFTSFVFSGSIFEALVIGAGVLTGFYTGFIVLFSLWFFLNRE